MNIIQKDWKWPYPLTPRGSTMYIVVHHTAGPQMQDTQAIWDEHVRIGDNGIAYHRVIKGDGKTIQGRPDHTVGAHAHGVNHTSIGIVLEGNFQGVDTPTPEQLAALHDNLRDLLAKYKGAKIIGHREVAAITGDPGDATACPGSTLAAMLPEIIKNL
jgi:N-acetylmuramoyl-L-alanine amidase